MLNYQRWRFANKQIEFVDIADSNLCARQFGCRFDPVSKIVVTIISGLSHNSGKLVKVHIRIGVEFVDNIASRHARYIGCPDLVI
jgi:hypothetical protein